MKRPGRPADWCNLRWGLPAFLAVLLGACTDDAQRSGTALVRDSAGVRIVENVAPSWSEGEAWRVEESPAVEIGLLDGPEPYQLFQVGAAKRLSDGRIVVANVGTGELRFYDTEGRHLLSAGGKGGGPGEFQNLEVVLLSRGDSIIAYDPPDVAVFDPDGTYLRTARIEGAISKSFHALRAVGLLRSHLLALRALPNYWTVEFTDGVNRKPSLYGTFDFTTREFDSLGTYPGYETYVEHTTWGVNERVFPFGKVAYIAARGEKIVIADNAGHALEVRDARGRLQMFIRFSRPVLPVTEERMDRWIEDRLAPYQSASPQQRAQWARGFREFPVAETVPAYRSIELDHDGNIWVEDFLPTHAAKTYQVFTADGIWLGGVGVPFALKPLDIGRDYLLGLWRDSLDVEHVRLHELIKEPRP